MPADSALNATGAGEKMPSTELRARSKPIIRISMATIRPAMYSAPAMTRTDVSLSSRLPERRKPTSVIAEESASEEVVEGVGGHGDGAASPRRANALAANSTALSAMPTAPHSTPVGAPHGGIGGIPAVRDEKSCQQANHAQHIPFHTISACSLEFATAHTLQILVYILML